MPLCNFYTAKFTQCTHNTRRAEDEYCGVHAAKAGRLGPRPAGCPCIVARHWCGMPLLEGHAICERHNRRRETQANRVAERANFQAATTLLTDEYRLMNPPPDWMWVADDLQERMTQPVGDPSRLDSLTAYGVARRYFLLTTPMGMPITALMNYWIGVPLDAPHPLDAPPAPPAPVGGLQGLATDTQNVHTRVVVEQTNTNLEILLESADVANRLADFDPEQWATTWWFLMPGGPRYAAYHKVMQDVHYWFTKKTCKSAGDWLYRQAFTGVAFMIHEVDDRDRRYELAKRLWEECQEAVDMCCEGHISRLANVFVGFDAAFKSPASPNEMLQTQLAEIAQLKLRPETKLAKAREVMDALGIPIADRAPWLEALEE